MLFHFVITSPARSLPHARMYCPTVKMIKSMQTFQTFNLGRKIPPSTQLCYPNLCCLLFPLVDREDLRPRVENLKVKILTTELLLTVKCENSFSSWLCPVRVSAWI